MLMTPDELHTFLDELWSVIAKDLYDNKPEADGLDGWYWMSFSVFDDNEADCQIEQGVYHCMGLGEEIVEYRFFKGADGYDFDVTISRIGCEYKMAGEIDNDVLETFMVAKLKYM